MKNEEVRVSSFKLHSVQRYSPIILNRIADKLNNARYDYLSAILFRIIGP